MLRIIGLSLGTKGKKTIVTNEIVQIRDFLRVALVRVYLFRCSMQLQRAFNKNFGFGVCALLCFSDSSQRF
jgi:hypothetical protein